LITALQEKTRFKKIIVTTRPHMKDDLEKNFNVFAYQIKPLSKVKQSECLARMWSTCLKNADEKQPPDSNQYERLQTYVEAVMDKLSDSLAYRDAELTGVPLQIRLLAGAFETNRGEENWEGCREYLKATEDRPPNLPEKLDLVDLYDLFVQKKYFDVYCRDKLKRDSAICGNTEEQLKAFDSFVLEHQMLAADIIFSEDLGNLLSTDEEEKIEHLKKAFLQGTERRGILDKIIDDKVQFLHLTFAEYFAAKYLLQNLKPTEKLGLLEEILTDFRYNVLRTFLDGLLGKSRGKVQIKIFGGFGKKHFESSQAFETAAFESNCHILTSLVSNLTNTKKKQVVNVRIDFSIAVERSTTSMIELLCDLGADLFREGVNSAISSRRLDAIKVLCDKGAELRLSSVARAIKTNDLNVVKLFSELIVNADEERQTNLLHQTAIDGSFEILHWLVTGQPDGTGLKLKPDKYNRTVLHHAALRNTRDMCQGILENKLADVSCKNNEGKTAIDTAVEYNNWRVVLCLLKNGASGTGELLIASVI
jgi:hypothetical protein